MKGLEDETNLTCAGTGTRILVQFGKGCFVQADLAPGWHIQARQDRQQRGFT